jgi:hypothetical protein
LTVLIHPMLVRSMSALPNISSTLPQKKSKHERKDLTSSGAGLKYRQFPAKCPSRATGKLKPGFMTPSSPSPIPDNKTDKPPCKHPRVQIVAREEDSEFVECKECGEIFESSEFKDMIIEDEKLPKEF